jgi:hypothetical protein
LKEGLICLIFLNLKKNQVRREPTGVGDYELGSILTELLLKEMDDDRIESRLVSADHS